MTFETLQVRDQSGVCWIRFHRPEARNALDARMVRELGTLLKDLESQEDIKVVVLEGTGEVFCSGLDFQDYVERMSEDVSGTSARSLASDFFALLEQMDHTSKITVAKVQGRASAGGLGLVAACDFVVADQDATFALPELLFGLLPAAVLPFLIRRMGSQKARLLALSTRPISAEEARECGLVDTCSSDVDVLLRPYLQRWQRVSTLTVAQLKAYLRTLNSKMEGSKTVEDGAVRTLAIETLSEKLADPERTEKIRRYVETGLPPWAT